MRISLPNRRRPIFWRVYCTPLNYPDRGTATTRRSAVENARSRFSPVLRNRAQEFRAVDLPIVNSGKCADLSLVAPIKNHQESRYE